MIPSHPHEPLRFQNRQYTCVCDYGQFAIRWKCKHEKLTEIYAIVATLVDLMALMILCAVALRMAYNLQKHRVPIH
eukprot:scaffold11619_cov29-Attheya_sp.AAC.1